MPNGEGQGEIIVKMILSGEELERLLGAMPAGTNVTVAQQPQKVAIEKASPPFMSIFKPLAAMEAVKVGVKSLVQSSSVANTYLGAMGKVFGAAIDLLLLPFMPLFNMLLVAMGLLVKWLVTSGVLEKIREGVDNTVDFLKEMGGHLQNIWNAIRDFNLGDLAKEIGFSVGDVAKFALQHPIEAAIAGLGTALLARGAWRFLFGRAAAGGGMTPGFMGIGAGTRMLGGGSTMMGLWRGARIGAGGAMMGYPAYQMATGGPVFGQTGKAGGLAGLASMTAGGAVMGSMFGPWGTAIGGAGGAGLWAGMKLGEKLGWWGGGGDTQDDILEEMQRQTALFEKMYRVEIERGAGARVKQDITIQTQGDPAILSSEIEARARESGLTAAGE